MRLTGETNGFVRYSATQHISGNLQYFDRKCGAVLDTARGGEFGGHCCGVIGRRAFCFADSVG